LMFVEEAFLKLFLGVPLIIGAWFLIFLQDDSPPYVLNAFSSSCLTE
jgi:hypothetical protein